MFLYSHWRALPLQTRILLANEFGIKKTSSTHVSNNEVVSDGYKIEDVEKGLSVENIQKYIGVEHANPEVMWDLMVAKAEGKQLVNGVPIAVAMGNASLPIGSQVELKAGDVFPKADGVFVKKRGRPFGSKNKPVTTN